MPEPLKILSDEEMADQMFRAWIEAEELLLRAQDMLTTLGSIPMVGEWLEDVDEYLNAGWRS